MQYNEFIDQVEAKGSFESRDQAVETTRVVLATLGERLYRTEVEGIASQLPNELKAFLLERDGGETFPRDTDRYDLEEFYQRVSARSDQGYPAARRNTQAVMSVLRKAVTTGELEDALGTLPDEYRGLFF